ncbi:MAG: cytochrome c [Alphaproteobacteria bacterium]|nr:cytochrome c [Alphaproteobacteria bacterium]MBV9694259.1 cytochrome c [Alphaproteobacteria bacterium]
MQIASKSFVVPMIAFLGGVVLLPVCIFVLAVAGLLSSDATSTPPKWESAIGQAALHASLRRRASGLHDPLAGSDAELAAGLTTYMNTCAGCHGDFSRHGWGFNGLYPRAPQFGKAPPTLTAEETYAAVKFGVRYSAMGANQHMPEKDAWQVATFVSRLRSLPPAVSAAWTAKPKQ